MATDTLLAAPDHRAAEGSAQDPDARFAEAYARHRAELVGWLRARLRDEAAAEDVCQEAYARLLREMRAGRAPDNELAWLRQVSRNLVISRARHAQVVLRRTPPPPPEAPEGDPTLELAVGRERVAEVRAAMGAMSHAERAIIGLALEGCSAAAIAAILGIGEGAARTRLHRARRTLQRRLRPD